MDEQAELRAAIAALEAQRGVLGDAVVAAALRPLRDRLAALAAQGPAAGQELKFVSVLFADVVGSTAMGRSLDPEDISAIIDGALLRLTQAIERHGGQVRSYMGDGFMALFGLPAAREDDAERAVRAGLALLAEAKNYAGEVASEAGVADFSIRVGINTGQVIVGGGVDRDTNALGMATNLAARLQAAAPPGGLLITHETYRQVRGVFDVQAQPPLTVKGSDEPLQTYLVLAARPRAFRMRTRGVEGVETPLVGRADELQRLQDALRATMAEGNCRLVTVTGEAGLGKSRLIDEFASWVDLLPEEIDYFPARAQPAMQDRAYSLLRDLFSNRLRLPDNVPAEVVRERLTQELDGARGTVTAPRSAAPRAAFVGQLLGYDMTDSPSSPGGREPAGLEDPRQVRDRALAYLGDYLARLARRSPVLVLLEDIHWADDSSLDAIRDLGPALIGAPILLLCTARPELFECRPQWGEGYPRIDRLALARLSETESDRLSREILRKVAELPPALNGLIVRSAEGNPFYIEELIRMFIEEGVIQAGDGAWSVELQRLAAERVPPTLVGILRARLDALAPPERKLLQRAAVIGRVFWEAAVARLAEDGGRPGTDVARPAPEGEQGPGAAVGPPLAESLGRLQHKEMIYRHVESTFEGTAEYLFEHALLRDVTYESVLKRDRRAYHARSAGWLAGLTEASGRADEYASLIAGHYERAGQTEAAARWYGRAGRWAAGQYANAEAVRLLTRALELSPGAGQAPERFALLMARERANDLLGARDAQAQDLASLATLAQTLENDKEAEVCLRRAHYADATGDYLSAVAQAEQATALAREAGNVALEAAGLLAQGWAYWRLADYETALDPLRQSLALAQSAGLGAEQAQAQRSLGTTYESLGRYTEARAGYEAALEHFRVAGDWVGESKALNDLGVLAHNQNAYPAARAYLEEAGRLKREMGDRAGESVVLNNLGVIAQQQGDHAAAQAYFEQCLRVCRETRDLEGEAAALTGLASVAGRLGNHAAARRGHEEALRIARQIGDRLGETGSLASLSQLAHEVGDDARAIELTEQALDLASEVGAQREQAFALAYLGNARLAQGRLAEAGDAFRRSYDIRRAVGEQALSLDALAGLAAVALAGGDLATALAHAEGLMPSLASDEVDGMDEPFEGYLRCYRVLLAAGDARAGQLVCAAHTRLQERAARLGDAERQAAYLAGTAAHREVVAAAAARQC